MYWLFETDILHWRNQMVQARLVAPPTNRLTETDCGYGFRGPKQMQPYGVDLKLAYQVDPRHPYPDNYFESFGFSLYSERLVGLMRSYGVKSEAFPVTLVDKRGTPLPELRYSVFHLMEGIFDAMDEQLSEWTGDRRVGIPRLVLDYSKFEHRPTFVIDRIFTPLMRDDLKQEIQRQGMTGFAFLAPGRYRSGSYGFPPDFDD